jgi:hypothetical protein
MTDLRRIVWLLTFLLAFPFSLEASQNGDWIKFEPEGGGFTVLMPSPPRPIEVKPKEDFISHLFTATRGNAVYIAGYVDYAPSVRLDASTELIINRDQFLRGLNAALTSSKPIELAGRSGLEFTGESDQYYFKSRFYVFGNRIHQIAVERPKGSEDSASTDRFFASFAFTNLHTGP